MKRWNPPIVGHIYRTREVIHYHECDEYGCTIPTGDYISEENYSVDVIKLPCGHTSPEDEVDVVTLNKDMTCTVKCPTCTNPVRLTNDHTEELRRIFQDSMKGWV